MTIHWMCFLDVCSCEFPRPAFFKIIAILQIRLTMPLLELWPKNLWLHPLSQMVRPTRIQYLLFCQRPCQVIFRTIELSTDKNFYSYIECCVKFLFFSWDLYIHTLSVRMSKLSKKLHMHVDAKYHLAGFLICLFFCIGSKEVACIKTQLMLWFLIYFTVFEKCTVVVKIFCFTKY